MSAAEPGEPGDHEAVTARSGARTRRRARSPGGVRKLYTDCRGVLGPDARLLPLLVTVSFVKGVLEAGLLLLIVQMAIALAAQDDTFAVTLGPMSSDEIALSTGVLAGLVGILILIALLGPVAWLGGTLASRAQLRTRSRLVDAYLGATWAARAHYPEGHLQALLTTYSERSERAVTQLVTASVALCGLVAIVLTAFLSSPLVAAGAIVCVGAVGGMLRPMMMMTRRSSSEYAVDERTFAARSAELARMAPEITAFDVAEPVKQVIERQSGDVASSLRRVRTLSRLGSSLYQHVALLLIVVSIGAAQALADRAGLTAAGAVLLLLVRALSYGQQLQVQIQGSHENSPFLERIELEVAALVSERASATGTPIDEPVPLRLDAVHFGYEPGNDILDGLSLELGEGEALGVVGRSGAGKSTLLALLLRLHSPQRGTITAAGIPLETVPLSCWYSLIAYVPQDNKLITGTVAENIRFFREGLDDETIEHAARRAHLHDEIVALPDGYATRVGPGVRELSGGQRQRLGVARALAGGPRLLILDEPTSSLDQRSEELITATLAGLRGDVTLVIVAHRPSTTAICDRIVRIEDGRANPVAPEGSDGLVGSAG